MENIVDGGQTTAPAGLALGKLGLVAQPAPPDPVLVAPSLCHRVCVTAPLAPHPRWSNPWALLPPSGKFSLFFTPASENLFFLLQNGAFSPKTSPCLCRGGVRAPRALIKPWLINPLLTRPGAPQETQTRVTPTPAGRETGSAGSGKFFGVAAPAKPLLGSPAAPGGAPEQG